VESATTAVVSKTQVETQLLCKIYYEYNNSMFMILNYYKLNFSGILKAIVIRREINKMVNS